MSYIFMMLCSSELVGIHHRINLTTTLTGRCCPHSADDENEAKRDEVTCLKTHSHMAAEAGDDSCSFF